MVYYFGRIDGWTDWSFIPTISEVAKDMNTSETIVNYTAGIYSLVIALGDLMWAPYAGYYGRQPVFLCSLPLITVGSFIAAEAGTIFWLVIGRSIQGFGASCILSVGAATISDIYKLEERGTAMGIFFGFILLGPPLAPISGGFLATYASWRIMQIVLGIFGFIAFLIVLVYLPETSHPGERGIDKAIVMQKVQKKKKKSRQAKICVYGGVANVAEDDGSYSEIPCHVNGIINNWHWVWLNPFAAISLLKAPVVLLNVLSASLIVIIYYMLMIPLPFTIGPAYGLDTPAGIGLSFLPFGLAGAVVAGRIADATVVRGRKRRHGRWYPEDRLLATVPAGLVLVPFALIIFAYTITYIPGKLGLWISLTCLFVSGMGADMIVTTTCTYLVDILRTRGAEAVALSCTARNGLGAIAIALTLPLLDRIGLVSINFIAAFFGWAAFACLAITMKYGDKLRAMVDVGYTTIEDV
ncbi:hypothetical protein Clacol_009565 [Clathrus columnatus]|uniref:Major facilitator superfamily (MFS) profile domain-containing protein n=1 Tax=Clathrus columnatus TaxID=1419009 RepID=A0AAV5AQ53_9AGAM|nr:hypothetical protein Clacol_009565 [Clathrus columnatus]